MTIFKNGFPFRGLLEFKRRKREYIFSGSNSYASVGKIRLIKDSPSTDLTKGKVKYSTTLLKLHHVSQPFLPKVLYENSSRLRCTQSNAMANKIVKKEIRKVKLDYSSVIRCIPLCHRKSNYHSNLLYKNFEIIPDTKNCKNRLTGCSNCRFYSQVSLEDLTFGEILSKRKNVDSSEKDYSLSSNIPSYMLRNSKYPTLAICPKVNEQEDIQTQNRDVSYYSFDSKNVNSSKMQNENIVRKPVGSLSVQRKETELSLANDYKLSNDFIQYISVDKIPKNTLHLSTLYEQYFSSKIYFVKLNKIDNETEVKIRKLTRQVYPLNRKHIVLSDPVLKYLHFFNTSGNECTFKDNGDENINKDNKLYCIPPEKEDHKQGIREKSVSRDQLPPDTSHNSQSILNIINSIDRSEAIIHKDLYITNKVVDLLKEGEKKKENQPGTDKKDKFEAKDSQSLSTNVGQDLLEKNEQLANETVKVQDVPCDSCGINAVENEILLYNEVGTKPILANANEDLSNDYEISASESEKEHNQIYNRYESCGINSKKKLSEENNLGSTSNHDLFKNNQHFVTESGKQINYSNSSKSQEINATDKLFSYEEAENNLRAAYSNEDSVNNSEILITEIAKDMRQTSKPTESPGIYPVENLTPQDIKNENKSLSKHINQYLSNNELLTNITARKEATKIYISKNGSAFGMIPAGKLSSQTSSVDRKTVSTNKKNNSIEHSETSNTITITPLDKKFGNQRDTRTTNISHFTYPPSFVDNIVTNLRNPSNPRTSQATTSQCRGSHSKSGNESDCTVDVLTETSITSTKFGERAKIQIHEVQTFKDRRLPLKFTTDTLMEMQGSNEKLRAATEVVEVAKAKLVLSRSNVDADMKSGVENAIKLAELLSFFKNKVLVGGGIESKKVPIEIEPMNNEIKPMAKQTAPKTSENLPESKTTNLSITKNNINLTKTDLTDKPKQNSVMQDKKNPEKLVTPKKPALTTSNNTEKEPTTKSLDLKDKLTESKQQTVDAKEMNKTLKKDKKPEDEVKVIKVRSQDLKKILSRSDNTEHSIRIVEKMEKKTQEEDNFKKHLRKGKNIKHLGEKKDKKVRLTNKLGKQNLKKIFDIKPFVKNPTKSETVERKTTETLQKNVNQGKKPEEVDLTARDLKIIEKIKKENEGISNTTKNAAPVSLGEASKKLKNIQGKNQDLSSNKNIFSFNAKLSTGPITYDVIKIPGDDEVKSKFQKPAKKEKEVIIIPGEKETGEVKERSTEPEKTIKESDLETKVKESMEMVAVKQIQIKNDNEVLQSYKNVIIKKTHRKPDIVRKSVAKIIEPIQVKATSGGKEQGKEADKSRNQTTVQFSKKSDNANLDGKHQNDLKQSAEEMKKEIDKYIHYQKQSAKIKLSSKKVPPDSKTAEVSAKESKTIGGIKQSTPNMKKDLGSEKKSVAKISKSSEIQPSLSKKLDVSAKDSKNIGSIKQSAEEIKKDLASEKKSAAKESKSSEIKPTLSKKPDVSVKDSKIIGGIKSSAKEVKKDLASEKKSAAKVSKSSEIKPPVPKKPDVRAKDSKIIGGTKPSAKEVKKDLASEKKSAAKESKSSEIKPTLSKKPDVSVKDSKIIGGIKSSAKEVKKDLASEKKSAAKVSKSSEIKPPVPKKPDVRAKDSKIIGGTKPSAKEVKKDLASEKKSAAKVSKSSEVKAPVSKKPDVSAKDSKIIGGIKPSAKEVKKDLATEKKSAAKGSKSSEIIPPVSKMPDVTAKDSQNIGSIKQSAKEMKKDLASEKKSAGKVSKSSEVKAPVSKKPDVSAKDSKIIGGIKPSAKEVKKDLATEKKSAAKVSQSSEIIPPVSKMPDVTAKDSQNIGSLKQRTKEVIKDLASEEKSAAKVSKSSEIKPPVSQKPDISTKDSKIIGGIKESAKNMKPDIKKNLVSEKKATAEDSKTLATKMPVSNALKKGISKELKVKSGVTLDKQSQKPVPAPDIKPESPKISKFVSSTPSDGSKVLSKPEIKDTSPDSVKETIPNYSSPVISARTIPTSFAKTKTISLSEDIFIDLDKLSKETKPALDKRGVKRSLVSLDKLMEFPLFNKHKTLYERPKDGIICVDCKKDLLLRQKLRIFPSVTRVLNATMSDSSRIALARWRSKMITDLGEAGFQEFYKGQIESGADFHEKVQRHFSGNIQDLVNSPNPALRSISNISKYISDVSVVESHVIHNKLSYRGIIDCVAKYNNKPVLIEWKRSDKKKTLIQNTFDAPLQLCAYIGALNFDTNYNIQVQGGIVVVAYSDGTPADVFTVPLDECQKYWKQWLGRLRQYMLDEYGKS